MASFSAIPACRCHIHALSPLAGRPSCLQTLARCYSGMFCMLSSALLRNIASELAILRNVLHPSYRLCPPFHQLCHPRCSAGISPLSTSDSKPGLHSCVYYLRVTLAAACREVSVHQSPQVTASVVSFGFAMVW